VHLSAVNYLMVGRLTLSRVKKLCIASFCVKLFITFAVDYTGYP